MDSRDLLFAVPAPAETALLFGVSDDNAAPEVPGSPTDLVFEAGAPASTDLVFGGAPGDVPELPAVVEIAITGAFAPLTVSVRVRSIDKVVVTGTFSPLTVVADVQYLSNTQRPTVSTIGMVCQVAAPAQAGIASGFADGVLRSSGWAAHQQRATHLAHGVQHHLPGRLRAARDSVRVSHQDASSLARSVKSAFQDAQRAVRQMLAHAFEDAAAVRSETSWRFQDGDRRKRHANTAHLQEARRVIAVRSSSMQRATPLSRRWVMAFQDGVPPPPGVSIYVPPGQPQPVPCYTPSGHLLFSFPVATDGHLLFQCGHYTPPVVAGVVVPVRRFYMVINSVSLVRLPSGVELPAYAFSMTVDADSWTWSWSATLDKSAAPHVVREPGSAAVELQAMVNGQPYRLMIDRAERSKQFPGERVTVSGRGLAAELDAPWAPVMTFGNQVDRTAQQLMSDVLTMNGVSIGWSVDWGVQDWLVPAGAWQMQGVYIGAVNDIAGAVGAYVQPHPTARVLRVLPRYPAAPWEWGDLTPDLQLPAAAVQLEGTEWVKKPAYNGVFVGGVSAGVFGPVTRAGTSGGLLAPQVTHALITDPVAHLQRGLAVLSDTGDQANVQLTLQVLPETGIIMPGTLLGYVSDDGPAIGIVRGTSVSWSRPRMRQTIEVETHHA